MLDLFLSVALGINAALAALLSFAVLPSLAQTLDLPVGALRWRRLLLPLAAVSMVLMVVALARGVTLAIVTITQIYPRFGL